MPPLFMRHQPHATGMQSMKAGLGGLIGIGLIGLLAELSNAPLLIAPFGASCVLLFSVPNSPLSQPANVVGGHLLATALALILHMILPDSWWSVALAVGLAICLMSLVRLTHPPAGADPIVVFSTSPGFEFVIFPILIGSILLVGAATLYHRISQEHIYPNPN